jgi:hypothetical protein
MTITTRVSFALLIAGSLLGCLDRAAPEEPVGEASSAILCEPFDESYCDPAFYTEVGQSLFACPDGVVMFAFTTPDCRWCIEKNVCGGHGGGWFPEG